MPYFRWSWTSTLKSPSTFAKALHSNSEVFDSFWTFEVLTRARLNWFLWWLTGDSQVLLILLVLPVKIYFLTRKSDRSQYACKKGGELARLIESPRMLPIRSTHSIYDMNQAPVPRLAIWRNVQYFTDAPGTFNGDLLFYTLVILLLFYIFWTITLFCIS